MAVIYFQKTPKAVAVKSSVSFPQNPVKTEDSEDKLQRTLKKASEITDRVRKDPATAEVVSAYLTQLEKTVETEKKAFDKSSDNVRQSRERLEGLKEKLDELIMKNESPDKISRTKEDFELEANILIEKQKSLNDSYRNLQTAQDQAIKDIIAQLP